MILKKIMVLAGLVFYTALAAWPFSGAPEPYGLLPGIAWQWIIRSHQIERVGFCFAMMPLWCLSIHRLLHHGMPGIKQYLMTYSIVIFPGMIMAGYLAYHLQAPDCLKTCPSERQLTLISMAFGAAVTTAMSLSVLVQLHKEVKT